MHNPFDDLTYEFKLVGTGDTHLVFSDGSDFSFGGLVARWNTDVTPPVPVYRYGLRNPDGTMGPDGPIVDVPRWKAWYAEHNWDWDVRLDSTPSVVNLNATGTAAWDGKKFLIDARDPQRPSAGYLSNDGGQTWIRISGAEHGGRYAGDPKNTGKSEDYIDMAWVGAELDEFVAKRGGVAIPTTNITSGFPGWTVDQYNAVPLPGGSIVGGPNNGPDSAPQYKQEGNQIVPTTPSTPAVTPTDTRPDTSVPPSIVTPSVGHPSESAFQKLRDEINKLEHGAATKFHSLLNSIEKHL